MLDGGCLGRWWVCWSTVMNRTHTRGGWGVGGATAVVGVGVGYNKNHEVAYLYPYFVCAAATCDRETAGSMET